MNNMVVWIEVGILVLVMAGLICWLKYLGSLREKNQDLQYNIDYLNQYCEEIESKVETVRKYRHDLANHIQTLEGLLAGDSDILNVFYTLKSQECRQKNIPLRFEELPPKNEIFFIPMSDLMSLLHNILGNAIEASEKIALPEDRDIAFSMKKTEKELIICSENNYRAAEPLTFQSDKPNREEHGLGMKIIKEITEKYKGSLKITVNETVHRVRLTVIFPEESAAGEITG